MILLFGQRCPASERRSWSRRVDRRWAINAPGRLTWLPDLFAFICVVSAQFVDNSAVMSLHDWSQSSCCRDLTTATLCSPVSQRQHSPLQRVLNGTARLVLDLKPRDHVTSALRVLHWLRIGQWVNYKLCLLVHETLAGHCIRLHFRPAHTDHRHAITLVVLCLQQRQPFSPTNRSEPGRKAAVTPCTMLQLILATTDRVPLTLHC